MKLTVTGRHIEITPAIQGHLEEKMEKLIHDLGEEADIHVILTVEKYRHIAEITIKGKGLSIFGEAETKDLYTAIDSALAKTDKQIKKHKEKNLTKRMKEGSTNKNLPLA